MRRCDALPALLTLVRFATVFFRLLIIPRLFASHIAGIEMILSVGILTGLLLIWVFVVVVVGHQMLLWHEVICSDV